MTSFRGMIWAIVFAVSCCSCSEKKAESMEEFQMTTHRIGRILVDLPVGFVLNGGASAIIVPGNNNLSGTKMEIHVVSGKVDKMAFEKDVAAREKELLTDGGDSENVLKKISRNSDGSVMFRIQEFQDAYISELDSIVGGSYLRITAVSYHGTFEQVEHTLLDFASRIVPREEGRREDFCIGTVCIAGSNSIEKADFVYRDMRRPDMRIDLSIDTFKSSSKETLLDRMDGSNSLLKVFDVKHRVLRKGELTISGIRAQEWLGVARSVEQRDDIEYGFSLETLRNDPALFMPFIHMELLSGQYDKDGKKQPNSLSDENAIRIWDAVVKSIRPQPVK